ncbi:helix-turn-helix domain-containing protein [Sporolactobacillus sp. KGMB 08714]|uniref:helix-turn-helix domain-containing protein n=1 Tax=Sporolactobacillus sp. KGMB 08714 TaxID=3064704 RepID=UPI002FBD8624
MELSKRIKSEREKQRISQDRLAEQLHVSRQAVSKWETGQSYPDLEKLVQLSEIFKITLDELVKGDKNLEKKLIKDGKNKMSGLAILGFVLVASAVLTIIWGGSLYPVNLLNSDFMSFLVGGLVLLFLGTISIHIAPIWLPLGTLWLMAAAIIIYLIGFAMPPAVTLIGIIVTLGFGWWLTTLILK